VIAMARSSRSIGELALLLAGPLVWAAHFFSMYTAETLFCIGPGAASRGGQLVLVAGTLTAAALGAVLAMLAARPSLGRTAPQATEAIARSLFWRDAPTALAALAMLGVLWTALPVLLVPACAPPA
jgi:hypothetical protein